MEGAAILDLETHGGPQRFMQHAAIEVTMNGETGTVVGFENHSGQTTLGPGAKPFGTIVAGAGNNGRDGTEGAVRDNVYATYLHGPVLPKNPWLTDQLIKIALERRMGQPVELTPLTTHRGGASPPGGPRQGDAQQRSVHRLTPAELVRNR